MRNFPFRSQNYPPREDVFIPEAQIKLNLRREDARLEEGVDLNNLLLCARAKTAGTAKFFQFRLT